MLAAVEDQRGEVGERRACREGAAVRVCPDLFEEAALDSASKTTDADPGVADLARRDRAVLTCRSVRQPADVVSHTATLKQGGARLTPCLALCHRIRRHFTYAVTQTEGRGSP